MTQGGRRCIHSALSRRERIKEPKGGNEGKKERKPMQSKERKKPKRTPKFSKETPCNAMQYKTNNTTKPNQPKFLANKSPTISILIAKEARLHPSQNTPPRQKLQTD
ncbi:hypothetical protein BOTNAR_0292g00190 [Botryotinia narcissicola]|uniref:Uncharacterized protein n=1 Tax=Botryotinia narcissicola TaxID=278944 RepID=A0A4Z1I4B1_9HELO|nr:hypothetical protein BOTNAR_0292g00190 [Botryotinia narcissicola]